MGENCSTIHIGADEKSSKRVTAGTEVEKQKVAKERSRLKNKSPRRNSWREEIKKIRGWRDEANDRKIRTKESGPRMNKVISDRRIKRISRFSRIGTLQRYEKLPSRVASMSRIMKDISDRVTKKRREEVEPHQQSSSSDTREESLIVPEQLITGVSVAGMEGLSKLESGNLKTAAAGVKTDQESNRGLESLKKEDLVNSEELGVRILKKDFSEKMLTMAGEKKIESVEMGCDEGTTSFLSDASAMARNFSLLELKMEVFTTRLKELEWEREQLRKERAVLQVPELVVTSFKENQGDYEAS